MKGMLLLFQLRFRVCMRSTCSWIKHTFESFGILIGELESMESSMDYRIAVGLKSIVLKNMISLPLDGLAKNVASRV